MDNLNLEKENTADQHQFDLSDLNTQITDLKGEKDTLEADKANLQTLIDTLKQEKTDMQTEIDELK